jgi:hypothetical protein
VAFKLVQDGIFQEEGISELLEAPGKLKNNFGTRNLSDNISDLRAQVAANNRGRALIEELVGSSLSLLLLTVSIASSYCCDRLKSMAFLWFKRIWNLFKTQQSEL